MAALTGKHLLFEMPEGVIRSFFIIACAGPVGVNATHASSPYSKSISLSASRIPLK